MVGKHGKGYVQSTDYQGPDREVHAMGIGHTVVCVTLCDRDTGASDRDVDTTHASDGCTNSTMRMGNNVQVLQRNWPRTRRTQPPDIIVRFQKRGLFSNNGPNIHAAGVETQYSMRDPSK